jgi:hypothetical protein
MIYYSEIDQSLPNRPTSYLARLQYLEKKMCLVSDLVVMYHEIMCLVSILVVMHHDIMCPVPVLWSFIMK